MYFAVNCAAASIAAFLPTIITTFGFSMSLPGLRRFQADRYYVCEANAIAQLLTVPPYAVSAIILYMVSYAADRLQSRGAFVAPAFAVGAIGYACVFSVS